MSIREEMKEVVEKAEGLALRKEMRLFMHSAEIYKDDVDVFGFVPYSMISKPIPGFTDDREFKEIIMPGAFSESLRGQVKMLFNHGQTFHRRSGNRMIFSQYFLVN